MTAFALGAALGFLLAALGAVRLHARREAGHGWCAACARVLGVGR